MSAVSPSIRRWRAIPGVDVLYFFFSPGLGTGVQPGPFGGGTGFHPGPSGFGTGVQVVFGFGSGVGFLFWGTGSFVAPGCGFGFSSLPICASSCWFRMTAVSGCNPHYPGGRVTPSLVLPR
jgi:hypothetical protein